MADILNEIVEGSVVKISQEAIDDNTLYEFEDYPVGGITNEQMENALTSSQSGFYQTNSVYMCIDGGTGKTYLKNHFYRFNLTSWEDVTPEFAGEIKEKTLEELETETIDDSTLYAIDDYPLGGITQAQMTNALKITQRGFYKVNSVYLCVDGDETSNYVKNHFYRFTYDETTDTYSWVDTKAGADVDSVLSLESENPVQNKVITENLNNKVSKTGDENIYGVKSFDVRPKLGIGDTLPNEYQEVEYIEFNKTHYIDTSATPFDSTKASNFKIQMEFMPLSAYDYSAIWGLASGTTSLESWIASDRVLYNRYSSNKIGVTTLTMNEKYTYSMLKLGSQAVQIKLNDISKTSSSGWDNQTANFWVGHRDSNYGHFRLYSLKVAYDLTATNEDNITLVRNFIPCYRKSDNTIGLYDTVSSTFFTNSGTGVFLKGENVYRGVDFATVEDVSEAKQELQTQIDDKVSLTKDEVIGGQKIFTERPQIGEIRLPSEYTGVEYIQSTGTQYIDTNYNPNGNTKVVFNYKDLEKNGGNLFGGYTSDWTNGFGLFSLLNTGYYVHYLSDTQVRNSFISSAEVILDKGTLYKDGVQIYTTSTKTFTSSSTMALCCAHIGLNYQSTVSLKILSCKIYDDNTLVRDFIPCYTNQQVTNNNVTYESNTIGLYDTVNNIFYVNSGTGNFTKGKDVLTGQNVALQSELPTANPETTTETPSLTSITINGVDYKIEGGGGGGAVANYNYYWGDE